MSRTCTHMLFHLWNYFLLTSYTEIIPCRVQQAGTSVLNKRDTIKYRARAVWYVEDDFHTWPFCVFDDRWFVFGSDLRLGLESSQIFRTRPESVKYKVTLVSLEPLWWHSFFFFFFGLFVLQSLRFFIGILLCEVLNWLCLRKIFDRILQAEKQNVLEYNDH